MTGAVLVDLDDTLFPQASWLDGAWQRVAAAAADHGVDPDAFDAALRADAAAGSARGGIIDRALGVVDGDPTLVPLLVDVFRTHRPRRLEPYAGAREALIRLRSTGLRLAIVSDGDVGIQEHKLVALGLTDAFDTVVFSDRLGRARRKPDPLPFLTALAAVDARPAEAWMIGDNPAKDVAGAAALGIRTVRVRTGEYAADPDPVPPDLEVPTFAAAVDHITGVPEPAR